MKCVHVREEHKILFLSLQLRGLAWIYLHNGFHISHYECSLMVQIVEAVELGEVDVEMLYGG